MTCRATRLLSGLSSASCLWWCDSLSPWVLHNMMQTLLTYCGALGRENTHQGLPLLYSLFSPAFQSGESISCTHTCTTHSFSLPSVYSAASDHLDLTCIVKMWAALPLSSSLSFTPFLFQLSVINVQVLQYLNRGGEESQEWGMNWWMGG